MKPIFLTEEPARRGFLRTLITAPAAALATHRLILPGETSPKERARRAWAEFSAAMREMTAGDDGWVILGAGERKPFRYLGRPYTAPRRARRGRSIARAVGASRRDSRP
ncbi:hypothetical protein [Methylocystis sp. S23]|jgi:hypothetical protein